MFYFYAVVDESIVVSSGDPVRVREDVRVTINCSNLIDQAINAGFLNPTISWTKDGVPLTNGSQPSVVISADNRLCIITNTLMGVGGQLGNDGSYSCEVCTGVNCTINESCLAICGERNLFVLYVCEGLYFLGEPHISPPMHNPLQIGNTIIGECGHQIVVVPPITFPVMLTLTCSLHNGSGINGTLLYKDGVLLGDFTDPVIQVPNEDDLYGTYAFVVTTLKCGSDQALTRIHYLG